MNKDQIWINSMEWCAKHWGCHQMAERSYFICGYQFPVCARCTGIMIGYITAIIMIIKKVKISIKKAILLLLPVSIDGGIQYVTSYESKNVRRTITGFISGIGVIYLVWDVVSRLIVKLCSFISGLIIKNKK